MVIMCEPVYACVEAVQAQAAEPGLLVLLSPAGERLTQSVVRDLAGHKRVVLLCGRYEGFDERIRQGLRPREISIGDFVCNGGEVPAMVVIDTVIRYVPGVLGDPDSVVEESHSEAGRLEYPQYTRPRVFRGMEVPAVLLSGNHQAVARWREEQSRARSPTNEGETTAPSAIQSMQEAERQGDSHEEPIAPGGGGEAD
jgi:tRNA (guanine37-N1)-methyltransferase